jgi:hypothetical protein
MEMEWKYGNGNGNGILRNRKEYRISYVEAETEMKQRFSTERTWKWNFRF